MLCKSKIKTKHCKIGETLAIISKSQYEYKEGFFYIVININNKTFTLDENYVDVEDEFKSELVAFNVNKIPIFDDYILEKFTL